MKVFKNLFGDGSRIKASEIAIITGGRVKGLENCFVDINLHDTSIPIQEVPQHVWGSLPTRMVVMGEIARSGTLSTYIANKTSDIYGTYLVFSYGLPLRHYRMYNGVWDYSEM